ncbi:methylated-DNA--[protein]-cysteine S-methyltransferase [Salinadaptatus halalkaliphilus]|uniref:methylated-DNA--[protein]-cysteine S-methyltransferase n=1 Tax=Salinadaptatus halalkaliphilus TaxID=2419781 RepID=A0A4S3TR07_9EURY|nr:methylated-DNA--[protein]-cysteine S-methyltransferase [Salinadaptatus halalkaliphilus]THE65753.1 methylated-DNA--[protein]-cysteine S-methyltransferase [Salinadaptatus halalkaliphilus]
MEIHVREHDREIDASLIAEDAETIRKQVREYDAGERETFTLEIAYPETFTGEVMRAMIDIPYGETRTYGDLAADLDTAAVAVGQACSRNPIPVIVPCHRVVGADSLTGYGGGLELKRQLLALEGAAVVSSPSPDSQ